MSSRPAIRIAYLIDSLGMGGAERVLLTTLEHLDRDRFEPRVCVLQERNGNPLATAISSLGIPVDTVPVTRLRDPSALPRVVRYLRKSGADIAHTQLEFATVLGGPAARLARIPSVSTLHTFDDPLPGSRDAARSRLMWWSLRRAHDGVVAVSKAVGLHHIQRGKLRPERVITIYNGIDIDAFEVRDETDRTSTREKFGVAPEVPVVISVAVLREPKGIQHLIAALRGILDRVPEAMLVIVGEGDHGPALRRQVAELRLDGHVRFAGLQTDVAELLAMSDIFALPTLGDVLPTAIAEAMAAGLPVVASDVGGVPEMVVDNTTGILVPPADEPALADACTRLLRNREEARAMGLAGREVARERFDVRRQAARLGDFYVSLLDDR